MARVTNEAEPVPLASLGDGMLRVFELALAAEFAASPEMSRSTMLTSDAKEAGAGIFLAIDEPVLLIDEAEIGVHYSALPDVWRYLFHAARERGLQVFATTHSWDCIEAFQQAAAEEPEGSALLLRSEPKASDLERFAAILDADTDLERRWGEARGALLAAGYRDIPERPMPAGTIVHGPNLPPTGIWLMPDNRLPGILEDFLTFLVPTGDALLPLVDVFLDGIPEPARRFAIKDRSKARIHAWLAAQEQPGKPLGLALKARYLDAEADAIVPFLSWLRATLVD